MFDRTLGLSLGFLRAVVTLVSFVAILWVALGPAHLPLAAAPSQCPATWSGRPWCTPSSARGSPTSIGRPLIRLNFNQQRYEADFRFSLVRFRENTEGVALYRGEADELRGFRDRFADVVRNWWASCASRSG